MYLGTRGHDFRTWQVWVILRDLVGYTGEAGVLSEGHSQRKSWICLFR